jgi:N-acetylglucosamine-6-phosphate deacetylase
MSITIQARVLYTENGQIDHPVITVEDGLIASITAGEPNGSAEMLTAAFFDIHVHGAVSFDFMTASPAEITAAGRFLAAHGVAHYLPTTVTGPVDATLRALETLADAIEAAPALDAAVPVGIHLEGPFVSHAKRGVHPAGSLQPPSIALFDRLQQAARGHIRLLTLAPELPGALELTRHATAAGVRVSLGHSNATAMEAAAALAAGAVSATHTFNAMRALDHREPGILGVVLDRNGLYAELICDGVHVDPAMVRLWLRMKGPERAILVTDGISATGMPEGDYDLGGITVTVRDGVCRSGETLAGSVLTMDKAVANLQRFTTSPLNEAVRLAAQNPARMLGLSALNSLTPGSPANFNIFDGQGSDGQGSRVGSYLAGQRLSG